MRRRVFFKFLAAFLLVIAAATITLDFTLRQAWDASLRSQITKNLIEKTQLFAQRVQHDKSVPLAILVKQESDASGARATVIVTSGKVLADSDANAAEMENHATRPEFKSALAGTPGTATRRSHTVGIEFLYAAVPIPGGAVRLAYPLASIRQATDEVHRRILWASLLAILIAMLLAAVLAQASSGRLQRIQEFAERVAAGDLSARIAERSSDEISQVAAALDRTARQLESTFNQLEASRKELATLLDGIQDAVLAVSVDQRVQWTNGPMSRLLGRNQSSGIPVIDAIRDPEFLRAVQTTVAERSIQTAKVISLVPGRTFALTVAPMPGGGAVAAFHDETEVERVEKTRRDFISNVSHELRTPLTSVQGYTETLLEMPETTDAMRNFLLVIQKNAARMARLTEDLLTLASVESGEAKIEPAPVEAKELLQEAFQSFRDLAARRNLDLRITDSADAHVMADREAIHQVFANLLENAMKYGKSGGKIEIGSHTQASAVEFYVRDFGPGIHSEHLPRLFERFYRVDKARSWEAGGTGLGLAIVKHLVLNMGGSVRVESELNHGATFFFMLPMAETLEPANSARR